jgi:hypothetical protein
MTRAETVRKVPSDQSRHDRMAAAFRAGHDHRGVPRQGTGDINGHCRNIALLPVSAGGSRGPPLRYRRLTRLVTRGNHAACAWRPVPCRCSSYALSRGWRRWRSPILPIRPGSGDIGTTTISTTWSTSSAGRTPSSGFHRWLPVLRPPRSSSLNAPTPALRPRQSTRPLLRAPRR